MKLTTDSRTRSTDMNECLCNDDTRAETLFKFQCLKEIKDELLICRHYTNKTNVINTYTSKKSQIRVIVHGTHIKTVYIKVQYASTKSMCT